MTISFFFEMNVLLQLQSIKESFLAIMITFLLPFPPIPKLKISNTNNSDNY